MSFDIKFSSKASRTLVESRGSLPRDSTSILKAEPGKLHIKDTNLVLSLLVQVWFTLQTGDCDVNIDFRVESTLSTT